MSNKCKEISNCLCCICDNLDEIKLKYNDLLNSVEEINFNSNVSYSNSKEE